MDENNRTGRVIVDDSKPTGREVVQTATRAQTTKIEKAYKSNQSGQVKTHQTGQVKIHQTGQVTCFQTGQVKIHLLEMKNIFNG